MKDTKNLGYRIEPVFDGINTAVSQYKVVDVHGNIWFYGNKEKCYLYLKDNLLNYYETKEQIL
jgi:hypothetical protein